MDSKTPILDIVRVCVSLTFNVPISEITEETKFKDDLHADTFDMVLLSETLSAEIKIDFLDSYLDRIEAVKDILAFVNLGLEQKRIREDARKVF